MARDICAEVAPPEIVLPDGVRVACHLWPAGSDGVTPAWTTASRPEIVIGADAVSGESTEPTEAPPAGPAGTAERAGMSERAEPGR